MTAAVLILVVAALAPAAPDTTDALVPRGFTEVVASVGDLEKAEAYYREVGGWEVRHRGPLDPRWCELYGLGEGAHATEVLLGNPGDDTGLLRLIRFHVVPTAVIRSSARVWDTGGIFDFNVRVPDAWFKFTESRERGWHAYSDPVEFRFGKFVVREVLVRGHDEVVVAMIQRVEPPLGEGWNLGQFSRIFNATQIVRDLDEAKRFYIEKLGFRVYMEHEGPSKEPGPNVLGLPYNLASTVSRKIVIVSPDGRNEGSVELLQFVGLEGKDCSGRAAPPNRGILAHRFPVSDIERFREELVANDVEVRAGPATVRMEPFGEVRILAIQSPEGAWLEFYEPVDPAPGEDPGS